MTYRRNYLHKKYFAYVWRRISFGFLLFWYMVFHPHHLRYVHIQHDFDNESIDAVPELPWVTFEAIDWLIEHINKQSVVFEWGSGGSTLFLAKRVAQITSIEHDASWYGKISPLLETTNLSNFEYLLIDQSVSNYQVAYARAIRAYPDNSFDLVFIDAVARNECIKEALSKVKHGGTILLDNSERSEYAEAIALLSKWPRIDFYGPGLHNRYFWQTSVFLKP